MRELRLLLLMLLILTIPLNVYSDNLFVKVGKDFGISPQLLYAIAVVESGVKPYAIGVKGARCRDFKEITCYQRGKWVSLYPENYEEAERVLRIILKKDLHYDLGLMQISKFEIERRGLDPFSLLDYKKNLELGARILYEKIQKYGYSWEAVWRYNGRIDYAWKVRAILLPKNPQ